MTEMFCTDVESKARNSTSTTHDRANGAGLPAYTSASAEIKEYLPPTQRLSQVVAPQQYELEVLTVTG